MDRDIAFWLIGQIDAIRKLAQEVSTTITHQGLPGVDVDMRAVEYPCNAAIEKVRAAIKSEGNK
jgi:anti-anti-sigma regulatory factor